jgi:hypothetical protein
LLTWVLFTELDLNLKVLGWDFAQLTPSQLNPCVSWQSQREEAQNCTTKYMYRAEQEMMLPRPAPRSSQCRAPKRTSRYMMSVHGMSQCVHAHYLSRDSVTGRLAFATRQPTNLDVQTIPFFMVLVRLIRPAGLKVLVGQTTQEASNHFR